jgi:hypothetical protein
MQHCYIQSMANCYFAKPHGMQHCYIPFSMRLIQNALLALARHREYLDHILFWTTADLENKLLDFRTYFNNHRTHDSLEGRTPDTSVSRPIANLRPIRWQPHCRALYQTPVAA